MSVKHKIINQKLKLLHALHCMRIFIYITLRIRLHFMTLNKTISILEENYEIENNSINNTYGLVTFSM